MDKLLKVVCLNFLVMFFPFLSVSPPLLVGVRYSLALVPLSSLQVAGLLQRLSRGSTNEPARPLTTSRPSRKPRRSQRKKTLSSLDSLKMLSQQTPRPTLLRPTPRIPFSLVLLRAKKWQSR